MLFDTKKSFTAGLGYSQSAALPGQDYFYWNLGASWFVTSYLTLDARYVDARLSHKKLLQKCSTIRAPKILA